jgi:hypothetical protein
LESFMFVSLITTHDLARFPESKDDDDKIFR